MTEQVQAESTVAPKLTRREQLLKRYNELAKRSEEITLQLQTISNEINQIDALENVTDNSVVTISVGKGEAAKDVQAVVVGVRLEDDGTKSYKVAYGSGFDADIAVIKAWRIKGVAVANAPSAPQVYA